MGHLDVHPTHRGGAPVAHLRVDGAAHQVPGRALGGGIEAFHEAFAGAVQQIPSGPAQALLEHRAGHAGVGTREQSGRVELHHLHVAQRQARAQRHRQPVARLVAGRGVVEVHGGAGAGGEQHRLGGDEAVGAGAHVDQQHTRDSRAVPGGDELDGAVLLEPAHVEGEHLLHHPVDDLDAGEIALVHGAVEALPRERLLVDGAVRVAVEEAADLVLELADALHRAFDQPPREILPRQPLAADDGVHEVALHGILRGESRRCSRPAPCACSRTCRAAP